MSELTELIRAHPGDVGVVVRDLEGRVLYEHLADRVFPAASTIKVPLLVRALQHVERGALDLSSPIEMRAVDQVPGAGVLHELDPGLRLTLRDLLTLMIIVSDNTATNLVIDRVGAEDVNAFSQSLGLRETILLGGLQLPPERRNARQLAGERNRTTPREITEVLARLVRGELLSPELTDVALGILSRQQYKDIVGRHVPRDANGDLLFRVASKSGELLGVRHDVGIVWSPKPVIVAIMSEGGTDPREHPDNRDVALLARIARHLLMIHGDILPAVTGLD